MVKKNKVFKFNRKMQRKLVVLFSGISLAFVGLIARLMYIEYTSGEKYEKIVLSQQGYDSQTIAYQRGDITDVKGTVLATSVDVYNLILDCKVVNAKETTIDTTVDALVDCFGLDESEIRTLLTDNADSQYQVLLKELSYSEIEEFLELQEDSDNGISSGVWFEKEYERSYPYGSLASTVVGFIASGNVGMAGVENEYNDVLNGVNGRRYGYLNSDNDLETVIKEAEDGNNVVLTIDANIQSIVEEKIMNFQEEYRDNYREGAGSTNTAVIVMDPDTGEILALAQYPNYDSSNPRDLSAYFTEEEIEAMTSEEQLEFLNGLWQSYAVTETYEPGSTSKPFTVAAGLETGALSGDETYYCDGYEEISGYTIHCVSRSGHGLETIQEAIMNSCNDALMQMSYVIGIEDFVKYQHIFGFGLKTNVDLPGEARTDTLIYGLDNMTTIDLATNSFGQNYNCTMIQMASAFSSLINGGYYYQPHVVRKITDSDGNVVETYDANLVRETISEETSELIKTYLEATVSDGTATTAKVEGYSMGGKTGTAQKAGRDGVNYLVSFIGYAPADDPEVLVYVVVDEPNAEEQYHSTYAQQIAHDIFEEILPYMNIYPDEDTEETEDTTTTTVEEEALDTPESDIVSE